MSADIAAFYNELAEHYHLASMRIRTAQSSARRVYLGPCVRDGWVRLMDCACGIGTQTIGLARLGHNVAAQGGSRCS